MAKRISQLTQITASQLAQTDQIPVVDVSAGQTKYVTVKDLTGLPDVGWFATGESWSYSAANVVAVPTDATTKYTRGMYVRFSQTTGGTKHAVILAVTSTTLRLHMLGGATLANEAITSPVYSAEAAPIGISGIQMIALGVIPTCSVYKTGNQTVTANTFQRVTWDAELYDTAGIHDNVTNNGRFTVPTGFDGIWRIMGGVSTGSATGAQHLAVYKNGTIYRLQRYDVGSAVNGAATNSLELNLVAGDYIELFVYTASTSVLGATPPNQDPSIAQFTFVGRVS